MKLRYVFALVLGLLVAGGAVVSARLSLLQDTPAESGPVTDMVDVYVAAAEIPFGARVTEDLVTTQSWPRDAVPHVAFTDPALLFPSGEGARRAKSPFVAGELLIAPKLSVYGADIPAIIPSSSQWRAMAIRARGEALSANLVSPGDQVDVVFAQGTGRDVRAVTLVQGVRVLALSGAALITLEVSPEAAQSLALAQETGTLVITLHTGGSGAVDNLTSVDLRTLLQQEEPLPEEPDALPTNKPTIVIRRGNETSVQTVPRSGE